MSPTAQASRKRQFVRGYGDWSSSLTCISRPPIAEGVLPAHRFGSSAGRRRPDATAACRVMGCPAVRMPSSWPAVGVSAILSGRASV